MLVSWRTSCWCRQDEETGQLALNRQVIQTNLFLLLFQLFNIKNVCRSIMEARKGSFLLWPAPFTDRKPRLAWCAALWHHFLHLWGKCFCCEVWGPPAELLGLPWQLEDIQLLCFPLLNSIQIPPKKRAHSTSSCSNYCASAPSVFLLLSFFLLLHAAVSSFLGTTNMCLHHLFVEICFVFRCLL